MRSPLQDTLQGAAPRTRRRALPALIVAGVLAALVGASLAASISVNSGSDIEFGQGSATASACTASSNVSLTTAVDGSGSVTTSAISITGVNTSCNGKYLRASLIGSSQVRDQIVWHIANVSSCSGSITLSATVGGSETNTCVSTVSTVYPDSGVTNGSMRSSVAASNVTSVQLETSDSAFTASL